MTLIQSSGHSGEFVVMTSDIRITKLEYTYNPFTHNRVVQRETVAEMEKIKVEFLSSYVLIGFGGLHYLNEYVKNMIQERMDPSYDLGECTDVVRSVIKEIENGNLPRKHIKRWKEEYSLCIFMNGFYKNGDNGQVLFENGWSDVEVERTSPDDGICFSSYMPTTKNMSNTFLQEYLNALPESDSYHLQGFVNTMAWVHACISYLESVSVSPEMHYYYIAKSPDSNELARGEGSFNCGNLFPEVEKNLNQIKESIET